MSPEQKYLTETTLLQATKSVALTKPAELEGFAARHPEIAQHAHHQNSSENGKLARMRENFGHYGNSRQDLSEMSGKVTSFFPRGAVPDQNDTYRFMREIEISCSTRTEDRNHRMSKRLEDLVTD